MFSTADSTSKNSYSRASSQLQSKQLVHSKAFNAYIYKNQTNSQLQTILESLTEMISRTQDTFEHGFIARNKTTVNGSQAASPTKRLDAYCLANANKCQKQLVLLGARKFVLDSSWHGVRKQQERHKTEEDQYQVQTGDPTLQLSKYQNNASILPNINFNRLKRKEYKIQTQHTEESKKPSSRLPRSEFILKLRNEHKIQTKAQNSVEIQRLQAILLKNTKAVTTSVWVPPDNYPLLCGIVVWSASSRILTPVNSSPRRQTCMRKIRLQEVKTVSIAVVRVEKYILCRRAVGVKLFESLTRYFCQWLGEAEVEIEMILKRAEYKRGFAKEWGWTVVAAISIDFILVRYKSPINESCPPTEQ